jgi:chondroitin 4-sulfotransferase 11
LLKFGRFAPTEYVVIDEKRLVYIVNSKVACSSIKKTLIRKAVCDDYGGLIHHELSMNTLHKLPVAIRNEYDFFTFVRNPFDRLVSCYVDKFIKERSRGRDSMYFDDYLFGYLATTKDFSDFVRRIIKVPFFLSDRHFLPQCKLITDQGLSTLMIKKFESLECDFKSIKDRFELEDLPHFNYSKKIDWRLFYTKETAGLVCRYYKEDVEMFGYKDEYLGLLEFIEAKNDKGRL